MAKGFFNKSDDERIAKRTDAGSARADRSSSDREISEDREITDRVRASDRRSLLRDTNTLLPPPPEVPGYHSFWATTTNAKDPIEGRQRLGYTFITRAEAPNFEFSSLKSGETTEDRIMINEMVAMKLPYEDWKSDMTDMHFTLPKEQLIQLRNKARHMTDGRGKKIAYTGRNGQEGFEEGATDGFIDLAKMKQPTLQGVA